MTKEPEYPSPEQEALDHELMGLWPGEWPNREFVDLAFVGDPGMLIQDRLSGSISEVLFGGLSDEAHWENYANGLANDYLVELQTVGIDPPSYYDEPGDEPTDDMALLQEDFVGFLRQWRDAALQKLTPQIRALFPLAGTTFE